MSFLVSAAPRPTLSWVAARANLFSARLSAFYQSMVPQSETPMAYTQKFQLLADAAMSQVQGVLPAQVDDLLAKGAIALDVRDKEEHEVDHIAGSRHVSRGKLEMNIEGAIPGLDTVILCYCNAHNRGALSAVTLRGMGYTNARYIAGGLKAYRAL